jgi:hypothetical protein
MLLAFVGWRRAGDRQVEAGHIRAWHVPMDNNAGGKSRRSPRCRKYRVRQCSLEVVREHIVSYNSNLIPNVPDTVSLILRLSGKDAGSHDSVAVQAAGMRPVTREFRWILTGREIFYISPRGRLECRSAET